MKVRISSKMELSDMELGLRALAEAQSKLMDVICDELSVALQEALKDVPVKTGFLKSTLYLERAVDVIRIGAQAPYAGFVEFGTSKMAAQPYLDAAVKAHAENVLKVFKTDFESRKA
jgi:HK97 gp10 family phage protein